MKCSQENCDKDATLQHDHNGELIFACEEHWQKYKSVMEAIGSFIPTAYPIGTVSK